MATVSFEAWLDRTKPIEIAVPIFQSTETVVNFTVLDADRAAVNLTGYALQFAAKRVSDVVSLFDNACSLVVAASGTAKVTLSVTNTANAGEALGELRMYSGGDPAGTCTDRVQFRFRIVEKVA